MGTQQILLIILGAIVVSIAIGLGISMVNDYNSSTNRDALASDLEEAAGRAQAFFKMPISLAGGGGSFVGFDLHSIFRTLRTENGTYALEGAPTDSALVIVATGTNDGLDNLSKVKLRIKVMPARVELSVIN